MLRKTFQRLESVHSKRLLGQTRHVDELWIENPCSTSIHTERASADLNPTHSTVVHKITGTPNHRTMSSCNC
jgi:hypothetical protein